MQSVDLNLIISNAHENSCANIGLINPSEVHRIITINVPWIPRNRHALISDTMRQRLGLDINKTVPSRSVGSCFENVIPSRGPYQTCEDIHLSLDHINYRPISIVYPILVPDLPVDFVLGTLYFDDLNLTWSSNSNRLITRSEQEDETRRQTYRNIL